MDNVIANLELMPMRMNAGKGNRIGEWQVSYAGALHNAGLLSVNGLRTVEAAKHWGPLNPSTGANEHPRARDVGAGRPARPSEATTAHPKPLNLLPS